MKTETTQKENIHVKQDTKKTGDKIAIVLIRGFIDMDAEVKETLTRLSLKKKNNCVILEKNPVHLGMAKKVRDYATWGELDSETLAQLQKMAKPGKKTIGLNPPRKGYGRKGIKLSFSKKGALGYRGAKINDLLKRMM